MERHARSALQQEQKCAHGEKNSLAVRSEATFPEDDMRRGQARAEPLASRLKDVYQQKDS